MSNLTPNLKVLGPRSSVKREWMRDSVLTLGSLPVRILFLLLFSLLILGFGISLTRASQASDERPAQYIVPAMSLKDTAFTYPMLAAGIVENNSGARVLRFHLPAELVGANRDENILREVPGGLSTFRQYANPTLTATCTDGPSTTTCVLDYNRFYGPSIDPVAVDDVLTKKFGANPPMLAMMRARSGGFMKDPEGIVVLFH